MDIHDGINNTLLFIQYRLNVKDSVSPIKIIKNFHNLPQVECYPGHLNQVFMNIINNAIDVLEKDEFNLKIQKSENLFFLAFLILSVTAYLF